MSDQTNLIKFGDYTQEQAKAEEADLQTASYMKLEPGRTVIRVLPPPMGKNTPFQKCSQHYVKTPGAAKAIIFVCPRVMNGGRCPACEKADELSKSSFHADQQLGKDMWPTTQTLVNVIDRAHPEKGPRVLRISKTVHKALTDMRGSAVAGGNFVHPTDGFDIQITRVGTSKEDTRYTTLPARNSTPLHPDARVMQDWIDSQADLSAMARVPSYDEIRAKFGGGAVPTAAPAPSAQQPAKGPSVGDAMDAEFDEVS